MLYWDDNGTTTGTTATPNGTWGVDNFWNATQAGLLALLARPRQMVPTTPLGLKFNANGSAGPCHAWMRVASTANPTGTVIIIL